MKYTQVAADAFKKLQMNAGVLLSAFTPESGELDRNNIIAATGGGVTFSATPEFKDFAEDIDNIPNNTKEMKRIDRVEAKMSGTAKTVDTETAKRFIGAADLDPQTGKLTPRTDLALTDFQDVWWVGDYSDVNNGEEAGFMAIRLIDALNTSGFQLKSTDNGKGEFAFEFIGHYSLEDVSKVPYEMWIKSEEGDQPTGDDATLSALTIGALTLDPEFDPAVTSYTATTTNASNTITATATDSAATLELLFGETEIENGSSVTWDEGENTITVNVANGSERETYTVVVTKE